MGGRRSHRELSPQLGHLHARQRCTSESGDKSTYLVYALPEGLLKSKVARVELSTNEGKNWTSAKFTSPAAPYCWQLWKARVKVAPTTKSITVRATDAAGNTQPQRVAWNLKGYLFNAWHSVPIESK